MPGANLGDPCLQEDLRLREEDVEEVTIVLQPRIVKVTREGSKASCGTSGGCHPTQRAAVREASTGSISVNSDLEDK